MIDGDYYRRGADLLEANLCYPRSGGPKAVEVGLIDVRCAASLRIEYDFGRDGWVIRREEVVLLSDHSEEQQWPEVAFIAGNPP